MSARLISQEDIQSFINRIPPAPTVLTQTLEYVNEGDLTKAANTAEQDPALKAYLTNLVNKPIYGFKSKVHEIHQIFGILGISGAQQVIYNYMLSLLTPDKWELFDLDSATFHELQAHLSKKWQIILAHLGINDKDLETAITLLPASIIICEALFKTKKTDVELFKSSRHMDYNTILKHLTGKDLFDISADIASTWDMPSVVIDVVRAGSGTHPSEDAQINLLGQWMHLLLFLELSTPHAVEASLNDFIDFQIGYVEKIYQEFATVLDMS